MPTFTTIFNAPNPLSTFNNGWEAGGGRFEIPSSLLLAAPGATLVRVTIQTTATTANGNINDCWIGESGGLANRWAFDGNQQQLFFNGSASKNGINGSTAITTDAAPFVYNPAKTLIVAMFMSGTHLDLAAESTVSACTYDFYVGGASTSSQTNPAMTNPNNNGNVGLLKIEMGVIDPTYASVNSDPLPIVRDYRVAQSTTQPVNTWVLPVKPLDGGPSQARSTSFRTAVFSAQTTFVPQAQGTTAITPAALFFPAIKDEPRAPNYQTALKDSTEPAMAPVIPLTATPSVMSNLVRQEDLPRRRDYFRALQLSGPVGSFLLPPQPLNTGLVVNEQPRSSNYWPSLVSTTCPTPPPPPVAIAVASTPTVMANLVRGEDLPRRKDYGRALAPVTLLPGFTNLCQNMILNPGYESGAFAPSWFTTLPPPPSPITAANLIFGTSGTVATAYSTTSFTANAGQLVVVSVANADNAQIPTVSGLGGTWVQIGTQIDATNTRRVTMFREILGSNQTGTLAIDFAGVNQNNVSWDVSQFANVDTSGTHGSGAIVQVVGGLQTGTSTAFSIVLAPLASASNASLGFLRTLHEPPAIVAGSGFTELSQTSAFCGAEAEWALNRQSVTWTWASQTASPSGLAVEIKAAPPSVGSASVTSSGTHGGAFAGLLSSTGVTSFEDIHQTVTVQPFGDYTLTAWINTSSATGGFVGARTVTGSTWDQALWDVSAWDAGSVTLRSTPLSVTSGGYTQYTVFFNAGSNSSIIVFAGYTPPVGASSLEVDDWALVPQICSPQPIASAPSTFVPGVFDPLPPGKNYKVALESTTRPIRVTDPCANMVLDPGFEGISTLAPNWSVSGTPSSSGLDINVGTAHSGLNDSFIFNSGVNPTSFVAIQQLINVSPNTDYTFSGWITTHNTVNPVMGVENTDASFACIVPLQTNTSVGATTDPNSYVKYTVWFNSGPDTQIIAFFGYTPSLSLDSYINGDDFRLVPNSCDSWTPSTSFDLALQDDRPLQPDYRGVLASTTLPGAPRLLIAPPPPGGTMSDLGLQDDRAPARPDFRTALVSTTIPLWVFNPRQPASTPTTLFDVTLQDDRQPNQRDYHVVLASTMLPVGPKLLPVLTPSQWFNLSIIEDLPRRPNYWPALQTTMRQVGYGVAPAGSVQTPTNWFSRPAEPTPRPLISRAYISSRVEVFPPTQQCAKWDVSKWDSITDTWCGVPTRPTIFDTPDPPMPRAKDYRNVLASTTRPVGQLIGVVAGSPATPTTWFMAPIPPPPTAKDYRTVLGSTTRPIGQHLGSVPPPNTTPSNWFDKPTPAMPRQFIGKNYWTAISTTTSARYAPQVIKQPPPSPPLPPPCVVSFSDSLQTATVALAAGSSVTVTIAGAQAPLPVSLRGASSGVVTLVPGSSTTVAFGANEACPVVFAQELPAPQPVVPPDLGFELGLAQPGGVLGTFNGFDSLGII